MRLFRRLLGAVALVLGTAGLLLSVAGIFGVWVVRNRATAAILRVFEPVEEALVLVDETVVKVDALLEDTRQRVQSLPGEVQRFAREPGEERPMASVVSEIVDRDVPERVERLRRFVDLMHTKATKAATVLELIESLPVGPEVESEERLAGELEDVAGELAELSETLDQTQKTIVLLAVAADLSENGVQRVTDLSERMDAGLADVQGHVQQFSRTVADTRNEVAELKRKIPIWTAIAAAVATLLLAWLAWSQYSLVLHGWSLVRRRARSPSGDAPPTGPFMI